MGMVPRYGKLPVTGELMVKALQLPEGTEIVGAEYDAARGCVVLTVEHYDLAAMPDGSAPEILCIFQVTRAHYTARNAKGEWKPAKEVFK